MASDKSICFMLNEQPVRADNREVRGRTHSQWNPSRIHIDFGHNREDVLSSGLHVKGQWNNLALGAICFKHVPSQILESVQHKPRVGDVCVRFMPVTSQHGHYSSVVDLYNSNVANGSAMIAQKLISSYTGVEELHIPSIPMHVLVSEWNKSLCQFHDMIRCGDEALAREPLAKRRETVMTNVTELAYKNVPVASNHLWFAVHCIVAKPHLVKQVLQLVGSISSTLGKVCHTGEVQATTVPRDFRVTSGTKLYLIAKSVPVTGSNLTVLGDHAGVTLGLIWATNEDELHDHLRNSADCHYVHIGTEYGNTFKCNGFCEWRYYNHTVFERMITIGQEMAYTFEESSVLSGNTGESTRALHLM